MENANNPEVLAVIRLPTSQERRRREIMLCRLLLLEQRGVPATQARDYIARLFLGVTAGAVEASERSFQSLAATHATAGGINEQFLTNLVEHGLLTRVSEALDAVLHRIGVES